VGWSGERFTDSACATLFTTVAQCAVEFEPAARTNSQISYPRVINMSHKSYRTYQLGFVANLASGRRSSGFEYEASASTFSVFASAFSSSRHV
jgi:hypothetical protein